MYIDEHKVTEFIDEFSINSQDELIEFTNSINDILLPIIIGKEFKSDLDQVKSEFANIIDNLLTLCDEINKKYDIIITNIYDNGGYIYIDYNDESRKNSTIKIYADGNVDLGNLSSIIDMNKVTELRSNKSVYSFDFKTVYYSKYLIVSDLFRFLLK